MGRVRWRRILGLREFCTWLWLIFGCSRQLLKNKFFDLSTPKRKVDNIGKQMGGGTLGSGTMVCDTSTHKDHFTVKWFQNYFFYLIPHIIKVFLEFCIWDFLFPLTCSKFVSFKLEKCSYFLKRQNFGRNWLVPISKCFCGTHSHSAVSDKNRLILTYLIRAHFGGGGGR